MYTACPHCGRKYLPMREVWANGASLLGARTPLRCPGCNGLSHVALSGRNVLAAVAVLIFGVALTFPSALSNSLVSGFSGVTAAFVRVDVWAIAVIVAVLVLVFADPLQPIERPAPRSILVTVATMAFLASLLAYGVFLYLRHTD